jgi:hypothetical protein
VLYVVCREAPLACFSVSHRINELGYAVAMAAIPIAVLLEGDDSVKKQIKDHSVQLLRAIGNFNVLNYEEGLREVMKRHASES